MMIMVNCPEKLVAYASIVPSVLKKEIKSQLLPSNFQGKLTHLILNLFILNCQLAQKSPHSADRVIQLKHALVE